MMRKGSAVVKSGSGMRSRAKPGATTTTTSDGTSCSATEGDSSNSDSSLRIVEVPSSASKRSHKGSCRRNVLASSSYKKQLPFVVLFMGLFGMMLRQGMLSERRLSWLILSHMQQERIHPPMAAFDYTGNEMLATPSYFRSDSHTVGLPPIHMSRSRSNRRNRDFNRDNEPDYGNLELHSLVDAEEHRFRRVIRQADASRFHYERKEFLYEIDDPDEQMVAYEDMDFPARCTPPKWSYESQQVCNSLHELSYDRPPSAPDQLHSIRRLSNGHYRQSYLFTPNDSTMTPFVAKNFRFERPLTQRNMVNINVEARIMEGLSGSPLISNIYGHCGSTVLVEQGIELTYDMVPHMRDSDLDSRGRISQELLSEWEEQQEDGVYPMNTFTAVEKLDIALAFASSVAELHGFEGGVIAHDDISIDQWMFSTDGRVIFNDFNNNVPLKWNYRKNRYCSFWTQYPEGSFKAPEVYGEGDFAKEQVDLWPMGNLIFTLLTGLKPYYDYEDNHDIQRIVIKGKPPYINPLYRERSYIERRMVEIMDQCHQLYPGDRVDIFQVVAHLRETKATYKKQKEQRAKKRKEQQPSKTDQSDTEQRRKERAKERQAKRQRQKEAEEQQAEKEHQSEKERQSNKDQHKQSQEETPASKKDQHKQSQEETHPSNKDLHKQSQEETPQSKRAQQSQEEAPQAKEDQPQQIEEEAPQIKEEQQQQSEDEAPQIKEDQQQKQSRI